MEEGYEGLWTRNWAIISQRQICILAWPHCSTMGKEGRCKIHSDAKLVVGYFPGTIFLAFVLFLFCYFQMCLAFILLCVNPIFYDIMVFYIKIWLISNRLLHAPTRHLQCEVMSVKTIHQGNDDSHYCRLRGGAAVSESWLPACHRNAPSKLCFSLLLN